MFKEYQCEITWNDEEYEVTAELWAEGVYTVLKADDSGPEEIEIDYDPEWSSVVVYDPLTGEPIDHPDSEIVHRARGVFNNIYWSHVCYDEV